MNNKQEKTNEISSIIKEITESFTVLSDKAKVPTDAKKVAKAKEDDINRIRLAHAFRFRLFPQSRPQIDSFVKSVELSIAQESLEVKFYETVDPSTHNWITSMAEEGRVDKLVFISYDGEGKNQFEMHFEGCQMIDHTITYDYGSDDLAIHTVYLAFKKMTRLPKV